MARFFKVICFTYACFIAYRRIGCTNRLAPVTFTKAGGGRPERFVKAAFCLYESFWIPLADPPPNTLCPWAGGRARAFCACPCPRGVASETGGVGASPRKASPIKQLEPQAGEAAHFASEAANSREARGGIGDKREGGVPTAPPRRECGANLRASSSQCSKQQSFTDCLAFDETPSTNPRTRINPPMSEHVAQIGTGVCRISSLNTIKGQEPET